MIYKTIFFSVLLLFFVSCDDPEALKKELQALQAKMLILKAEKGNAETEVTKINAQLEEKNMALAQRDLDIEAITKELADKNIEIENILKNDPAKFWIEKLQPIITDCYKFEKEADIFVRYFSKDALNYDKVTKNLAYCKRQIQIDALTDKLNFKGAREIAKTPEELDRIQEAKDDFKKFDLLAKKVHDGNANDLYNYLAEDVIASFDLQEKYNTPLKIKTFKATSEYSKKLNKLKELKSLIKKEKYKIEIKGIFDEPYDPKQRGFLIKIGKGFGFTKEEAMPPYSYERFHFPYLEYQQTSSPFGELRPDIQSLVVKIHEGIATKIEKSPKTFKLFINFNVTGATTVKYKYFNNSQNDSGGLHDIEAKVVSTIDGEYELVDSKTGKKYYHLDELLEEDGI